MKLICKPVELQIVIEGLTSVGVTDEAAIARITFTTKPCQLLGKKRE